MKSKGLFRTLEKENTAIKQEKIKVMVVITTHLCEEYLAILDIENLYEHLVFRSDLLVEVIFQKLEMIDII